MAAAFNPDINPALLKLIQGFKYDKYGVNPVSGYRPGDKRQHGRGQAIDIELTDPKTGAALKNYQDPTTFGAYQQYANALYQHALQTDPELAKQLRWGGYFSGDKNVYGALDLMHFDTAGQTIPTAGGTWQGGLNPEQAKIWGLQPGGGLGAQAQAVDQQMAAAGYTPEQRRNAIASIESAGSGDYAATGAWTGDPQEGRDRAYGRYQMMGKNIGPWAQQYLQQSGVTPEQFLKDPQLQDKLFDAVYGGYAKQYGERGAASKWFTGSETEPARTDVNGKLTGKSYADRYMAALGATPSAGHPPNPTVGTGGYVAPGANATPVPGADEQPTTWWQRMAKNLGNMAPTGGLGDIQPARGGAPQPGAARIDQDAVATIDPQAAEAQRQQLAMAMQRLNSGRLF